MKSCCGSLKRDCSGSCEDYDECLILSVARDVKSSLRG